MKAHTDYVSDLALIEGPPAASNDHTQESRLNTKGLSVPFGDCSVLSASTDKTIRLTPFSFLDMQFA